MQSFWYLNETGEMHYLGLFRTFEEADVFLYENKFEAVYIFDEQSWKELRKSIVELD